MACFKVQDRGFFLKANVGISHFHGATATTILTSVLDFSFELRWSGTYFADVYLQQEINEICCIGLVIRSIERRRIPIVMSCECNCTQLTSFIGTFVFSMKSRFSCDAKADVIIAI